MLPSTKIYVGVPFDDKLTPRQVAIKEAIYKIISDNGFEIQHFRQSGIIAGEGWSLENLENVLRRCQGVIILAFNIGRYQMLNGQDFGTSSEYIHIEGAYARAQSLPTLIISEESNPKRGILQSASTYIPSDADTSWVNRKDFRDVFNPWCQQVRERCHVFLGYSSGARRTAQEVMTFLDFLSIRVLDWMKDFVPGGTILDEIQHAEKKCMGGIFLFTKDDEMIIGDQSRAAPRDNVIFEAGYFMNTKGKERTLLICEQNVNILANVGGIIYLPLTDRNDISSIKSGLERSIKTRF